MQQPRYHPQSDPDRIETFKSLASLFDIDLDQADDATAPSIREALSGLDGFTDLSTEVGFGLRDGLDIPIEDGQAKLFVKPGTYFNLRGDLEGPISDPRLKMIHLRATQRGEIELKMTKGFAAELAGLTIYSIRLLPGGKLSLEYDLIVERMGEGLIALARLFGAVATRDPRFLEGRAPDIKLNTFRQMVDEKVVEQVEPHIKALIRQYDQALPGFSLMKAFGL